MKEIQATSDAIARLADEIRLLVVNRPDALLYTPGKPVWGLLLQRSVDYAVLNLDGAARMAIAIDNSILPAPIDGCDYCLTVVPGRLMRALYAAGLPLVDQSGSAIKTVTIGQQTYNHCCDLSIANLPCINHAAIVQQNHAPVDITFTDKRGDSSLLPPWFKELTHHHIGLPCPETEEEWLTISRPHIDYLVTTLHLSTTAALSVCLTAEAGKLHLAGRTPPSWFPQRSAFADWANQHSQCLGVQTDQFIIGIRE